MSADGDGVDRHWRFGPPHYLLDGLLLGATAQTVCTQVGDVGRCQCNLIRKDALVSVPASARGQLRGRIVSVKVRVEGNGDQFYDRCRLRRDRLLARQSFRIRDRQELRLCFPIGRLLCRRGCHCPIQVSVRVLLVRDRGRGTSLVHSDRRFVFHVLRACQSVILDYWNCQQACQTQQTDEPSHELYLSCLRHSNESHPRLTNEGCQRLTIEGYKRRFEHSLCSRSSLPSYSPLSKG